MPNQLIDDRGSYTLRVDDGTAYIRPKVIGIPQRKQMQENHEDRPGTLQGMYREVADQFQNFHTKHGAAGIQFDLEQHSIYFSDPYIEDAVNGETCGDFPGSLLRGRHRFYDEENRDDPLLKSWDQLDDVTEGYRWQQQRSFERDDGLPDTESDFWLGWDIKIQPDGTGRIIEAHTGGFGTKGFRKAFQYGTFEHDVMDVEGDVGSFGEFVYGLVDHKDKTDKALGDLAPRLYESQQAIGDGEHVIVKPVNGDCGYNVDLVTPGDIPADDDMIVESFIPSKPVEYEGNHYDGCMRYVQHVSIDRDTVHITDFGGYWRIAPAPLDSDLPAREKILPNLSRGGSAITASFAELATAWETGVDGVQQLYRAWTSDFLVPDDIASGVTDVTLHKHQR